MIEMISMYLEQTAGIHHLVLHLEEVCAEAFRELEEELNNIQNAKMHSMKN